MKRVALAGAVLAMSSTMAFAEEAGNHTKDMSRLTCEEFVQMGAPDAIMTLFWIDGYLTKNDEQPVWDAESFVEHRDKLINICTAENGAGKFVLEEVRNLG